MVVLRFAFNESGSFNIHHVLCATHLGQSDADDGGAAAAVPLYVRTVRPPFTTNANLLQTFRLGACSNYDQTNPIIAGQKQVTYCLNDLLVKPDIDHFRLAGPHLTILAA